MRWLDKTSRTLPRGSYVHVDDCSVTIYDRQTCLARCRCCCPPRTGRHARMIGIPDIFIWQLAAWCCTSNLAAAHLDLDKSPLPMTETNAAHAPASRRRDHGNVWPDFSCFSLHRLLPSRYRNIIVQLLLCWFSSKINCRPFCSLHRCRPSTQNFRAEDRSPHLGTPTRRAASIRVLLPLCPLGRSSPPRLETGSSGSLWRKSSDPS